MDISVRKTESLAPCPPHPACPGCHLRGLCIYPQPSPVSAETGNCHQLSHIIGPGPTFSEWQDDCASPSCFDQLVPRSLPLCICPSPHCLPPWCSELASPRETLLSQLPTSPALVFQITCSIIFCSPLASSGTWLFTEATSSHYARHLSRCICIVSSWVLLKILLDAPSQNHTSFSHRSIFSLPFWSYASTCTRCMPLGKPLTS